jgi:acetolactate synthase-1/2/3 large subunit
VHTAFQDSTPMVLFVGDVASDQRDREAFQEVEYTSFFGPAPRAWPSASSASTTRPHPRVRRAAFATAMNGRPAPWCWCCRGHADEGDRGAAAGARGGTEAWSDPGALRTLREMLLAASKPFVIAGGGGWTPQAAQALQRFAENWKLPVGNAFRFQDTFDNHHPLYAGDVGIGINPKLAARVQESDLILAIGPRLGEMTTGGYTLLKPPRRSRSWCTSTPAPRS